VLAAIASAGIGVSACGSSSSSKTPATPAAITTAAITSAAIGAPPNNTPITDPKYYAYLAATLVRTAQSTGGHISSADASKAATCVIQKETSEGLKTAGDVSFAAGKAAGMECAKQLNLAAK
jgi:hypothetical protein